MNEHTIAAMTASAIGTKRKRATPSRKNIGTNTMQMHSSETKAGVTICAAPSRIAGSTSLPCSRCQLMFSIVTVASSTRMPTASARPPSVMILSVSPSAHSVATEPSTESGIEVAMITVERQLPRKISTITLVSAAAMMPSRMTPSTAALTNSDWSPTSAILRSGGTSDLSSATFCLMPAMIDSVEIAPFLSTSISTERLPSTWTILVCGELPSRTWPTSCR